jgi:hypothetical protein
VLLGEFKAGSTVLVTVEEGAGELSFEAVEAQSTPTASPVAAVND